MHYQEMKVKQLGETFSIVCTKFTWCTPRITTHLHWERSSQRSVYIWGGFDWSKYQKWKRKGKKGITHYRKEKKSFRERGGRFGLWVFDCLTKSPGTLILMAAALCAVQTLTDWQRLLRRVQALFSSSNTLWWWREEGFLLICKPKKQYAKTWKEMNV